jgi:hypothetical protein
MNDFAASLAAWTVARLAIVRRLDPGRELSVTSPIGLNCRGNCAHRTSTRRLEQRAVAQLAVTSASMPGKGVPASAAVARGLPRLGRLVPAPVHRPGHVDPALAGDLHGVLAAPPLGNPPLSLPARGAPGLAHLHFRLAQRAGLRIGRPTETPPTAFASACHYRPLCPAEHRRRYGIGPARARSPYRWLTTAMNLSHSPVSSASMCAWASILSQGSSSPSGATCGSRNGRTGHRRAGVPRGRRW